MVDVNIANFITIGLMSAAFIAAFQWIMTAMGWNASLIG